MADQEHQVIIHINLHPIAFADRAALLGYIDAQRKVAPNWQQYDTLPLALVVDDQTGEEFSFLTAAQVPQKTLMSSRVPSRSLLILKDDTSDNQVGANG